MNSRRSDSSALAGQYLTFTLKGQTYGIAIATVCEIDRMLHISPMPQAPDYVSGVMNLRGKVIPVVDLSRRFGFELTLPTRETCIIVTDGDCGQVGMIVDSVRGVINLGATQVQPPPDVKAPGQMNFVIGVAQAESQVIILVDTTSALTRNQFETTQTVDVADVEQEDAA